MLTDFIKDPQILISVSIVNESKKYSAPQAVNTHTVTNICYAAYYFSKNMFTYY